MKTLKDIFNKIDSAKLIRIYFFITIILTIFLLFLSVFPELTEKFSLYLLSVLLLSDESAKHIFILTKSSELKLFLIVNFCLCIYIYIIYYCIHNAIQEIKKHIDRKISQYDLQTNKRYSNENSKLFETFSINKKSICDPQTFNVSNAVTDLLSLVINYMHSWPICLDKTSNYNGIISNYYVYTLAASYQKQDLLVMKKYLRKVVERIIKNNDWCDKRKTFHLPVLISLQNRNVILINEISNEINVIDGIEIPLLVYQPASKKHVDVDPEKSKYELFYRVFLGCDELIMKLKIISSLLDCDRIILHGILIDDNITKGVSMIEVLIDSRMPGGFDNFVTDSDFVQEFSNKCGLINCNLSFSPIRDCATLFIASDKPLLDKQTALHLQFAKVGLNLWYYFILPEKIKESLWSVKMRNENYKTQKIDLQETLNMKFDNMNRLKEITKIPNGWINYNVDVFDQFIQCLNVEKGDNND